MAYKNEKALRKYAARVYANDPIARDRYELREMSKRRKRDRSTKRREEARARHANTYAGGEGTAYVQRST